MNKQTIGAMLERRAEDTPDATYAVFDDGTRWSYADARALAAQTAAALQRLDVGAGDRVLCWLPNGPELIRCWFGACWLGATYVPMNVSLRGGVLEHVVRTSRANVLVAHSGLVDRLAGIDLAALRTLVVVGAEASTDAALDLRRWDEVATDDEVLRNDDVADTDTQSIIYTSGTTGPSKGVLSSYRHLAATAEAAFADCLNSDDRYLVNLPLFHAGGTIGAYGMLALGGSIAVVDSFSTSSFWDTVRRLEITSCTLLGVMATFLMKEPPAPTDADNPLSIAYMVPLTEDAHAFSSRFGLDVLTMFNMTEVSCPLISERNPTTPGSCGRVRKGVEVRLVDDHGADVSEGEVGELLVRTDDRFALNSGYDGMPAETERAWADDWFHTGDAFRRDAEGNYFFVDRMKDAIRRRGENISSFEVEAEALACPDVREAAAVATPSEHGEDEVLLIVAPSVGHSIDERALHDFLAERMAHFMVPRYVRVIDDLPKTATNKIEKHLLRTEGVAAGTWDREAAGIKVTRERLT